MPDRALNPRVAVYTGTFDPVHLGHLDIISRGSQLYEKLVVGVGINPDKSPLFTLEERVQLVETVTRDFGNVEVRPFTGLAVQFVRGISAGVMLRGIRTTTDMENEFSMSLTNLHLDPGIETVFLMAKEAFSHVSSTMLRQIAALGGDLSKFLPEAVRQPLFDRAKPGRA